METRMIKFHKDIRQRLDCFLVEQPDIHTRSFARKLISKGKVSVNLSWDIKSGMLLKFSDTVEYTPFLDLEMDIVPEDIPLDIIFENSEMMVINKQSGLVVHPGAGNIQGTLVSGLLHHWGEVPEGLDSVRPGIVHRLDKDTSGVLIVAKTPQFQSYLSGLFKDRKIEKRYKALVYGKVKKSCDKIVTQIGRHVTERKKMSVHARNGRKAITEYCLDGVYVNPSENKQFFSLLSVRLHTGRTHQIRVHMKHIGHPVVGDRIYAGRKFIKMFQEAPRQLLHANSLKFVDSSGVERCFKADLPLDFNEYLNNLEKVS